MIKTKEDYIESLKKQKLNVYYKGKRVDDVTIHPALIPILTRRRKHTNWRCGRKTKTC